MPNLFAIQREQLSNVFARTLFGFFIYSVLPLSKTFKWHHLFVPLVILFTKQLKASWTKTKIEALLTNFSWNTMCKWFTLQDQLTFFTTFLIVGDLRILWDKNCALFLSLFPKTAFYSENHQNRWQYIALRVATV